MMNPAILPRRRPRAERACSFCRGQGRGWGAQHRTPRRRPRAERACSFCRGQGRGWGAQHRTPRRRL